jgi:lipopolysaccharide export system permease protein
MTMGILERYIARHVLIGTATALGVLVALFSILELVDDLSDVGRGDYTLMRALEYSVLRIPGRVFDMLPISALIGSIMGLGALTSTSELTAMRTSGVSVWAITAAVLKGGAALVLLSVIIGELVLPTTERAAHERRSVAITTDLALETDFGIWVRDGLSFVNIRRVLPDAALGDVYIFEFDKAYRLRVASHAKRATYQDDGWVLSGLAQSEIDEDKGVTARTVPSAVWHSPIGPDQVAAIPIRPEGLSIVGLIRYLRYLGNNGLSTTRYEYALWNKFVYPFAALVMVFVSVVLVLGPLRVVSLGLRLLVGIVIGVVFYIVQQTSLQVGVIYESGPVWSILTPPLIFLGLGVWLMRRLE